MAIWKKINGYNGIYWVSDEGEVRSIDRARYKGQLLKSWADKDSYLRVGLYKNKKRNWLGIHRLVAQAFIPNPNNYPQINHIDENPKNNRVENLEWCDPKYNVNYGNRNKRMIKNRKGKTAPKPIIQFDLDGNFIKEWASGMEAFRALKIRPCCIFNCCRGLCKQAGNFIWEFKKKKAA